MLNRYYVQNNVAYSTATVRVPAAPNRIEIDAELAVLFELDFNPGVEILRETYKNGSNVRSRLQSALQLTKIGSNDAISSVRTITKAEKFWGVRAHVAKALGEHAKTAVLPVVFETLAELLSAETEPRAMV